MKKPWNEHSSKWEVPWDERPEQKEYEFNPGVLMTAIVAVTFYGGGLYFILSIINSARV